MNVIYSNVMMAVTLGSVAFAIYRSYSVPDTEAHERIALLSQKLDFVIAKLTNDLPHLDAQIKDIHTDMSDLRQLVVKLQTIMEERLGRQA